MSTWRGRGVAWRMSGPCLVVLVVWLAATVVADRAAFAEGPADDAVAIPVPEGFASRTLDSFDRDAAIRRFGPGAVLLARFGAIDGGRVSELEVVDQPLFDGIRLSADGYAAARERMERFLAPHRVIDTALRPAFGYGDYRVTRTDGSIGNRIVWVGVGHTAYTEEIFGAALIEAPGGFLWLTFRRSPVSEAGMTAAQETLAAWAEAFEKADQPGTPATPRSSGSPAAVGRRPKDPVAEDVPTSSAPTTHHYGWRPRGRGGKGLGAAIVGLVVVVWRVIAGFFRRLFGRDA